MPLKRDWIVLLALVGICLGVGAIGALWTARSVAEWYPQIRKPPITPPNWLFGPVWTALYVLMGIAAWRVWRRAGLVGGRGSLAVFGFQLALNLAWSYLFFGMQNIGLALIEIIVLLVAIFATIILFARWDRVAAWLLAPYAAWVAFASVLNGWIWVLNRSP